MESYDLSQYEPVGEVSKGFDAGETIDFLKGLTGIYSSIEQTKNPQKFLPSPERTTEPERPAGSVPEVRPTVDYDKVLKIGALTLAGLTLAYIVLNNSK